MFPRAGHAGWWQIIEDLFRFPSSKHWFKQFDCELRDDENEPFDNDGSISFGYVGMILMPGMGKGKGKSKGLPDDWQAVLSLPFTPRAASSSMRSLLRCR